jgi:hypothetical protein
MKRVQQRARRRGSAGHLHQNTFTRQESFNGGATVSIDGLVGKWTTRKAMDVIQAKSVNAKASTSGAVRVSMGRGFRFARGTEAVAA